MADEIPIVEYEIIKDLPNHPEIILVDVRNADEVEKHGKIPTSINIPWPTLEETLNLTDEEFKKKFGRDKPTKQTEIIFHCMGGGRAGKATKLALQLGYEHSESYKGSFTDWATREGILKPENI